MEVIKIVPRGFCHGVISAMHKVNEALGNPNLPEPIYILGQIVHNDNITQAFAEKGVITLSGQTRADILDQVDKGTVIITAHGIDYRLIQKAKDRGLAVIDATCSDVYRTHEIIKEKTDQGYLVIYVGKKNHPEPEGAIAVNPRQVKLVETIADLEQLDLPQNSKICLTNQTTMSMWDVREIINRARELYPQILIIDEICGATRERQEAVAKQAVNLDLCLVVGDKNSNNSNRLVQVCQMQAGTKAHLIQTVADIELDWLLDPNVNKVGVTSGASTPSILTSQVVSYIEQFDKDNPQTHIKPELPPLFKMIPRKKN